MSLELFESYPQGLVEGLDSFFDGIPEARRLTDGMSPGDVFLIEDEGNQYILKVQEHERENDFYVKLAPSLREQGVALPELYLAGSQEEWHWVLIEHIPDAVSEEEDFPFAEEFIAYLRRFHSCRLPKERVQIGAPAWSEGDNNRALKLIESFLGPKHGLRRLLEDRRVESQRLFARVNLVTGDPARPNWGRRDNGELVKFDWRGIGKGTPALDLGILLGAFPSPEMEEQMAMLYLQKEAQTMEVKRLSADIHRAALWNVIKFLSGTYKGTALPKEGLIKELCEELPQWLEE